jgi:DNA-binding MarR family transcriptional regulator
MPKIGQPKETSQDDSETELLNRDQYIPWFLVRLSNGMTRGASKTYLKLFGVGIMEWRILSMLAIEGGILAAYICETLELDKASASRSIKTLQALNLIDVDEKASQRARKLYLTEEGKALHDQILKIAVERARLLTRNVSADEKAFLLALLRRMVSNLAAVDAYDSALIAEKTK